MFGAASRASWMFAHGAAQVPHGFATPKGGGYAKIRPTAAQAQADMPAASTITLACMTMPRPQMHGYRWRGMCASSYSHPSSSAGGYDGQSEHSAHSLRTNALRLPAFCHSGDRAI